MNFGEKVVGPEEFNRRRKEKEDIKKAPEGEEDLKNEKIQCDGCGEFFREGCYFTTPKCFGRVVRKKETEEQLKRNVIL